VPKKTIIGTDPVIAKDSLTKSSRPLFTFFRTKRRIFENKFVTLLPKRLIIAIMNINTGDSVLISPEVTHKSDWTQGTVIEVEDNPFVGTVISAKTPSGEIYFEKEYLFKPAY
jgi:hypothetical protein